MDSALMRVGLPVRCKTCMTTGFVRPGTDYGGWWRLGKLWWYCPEHAGKGKHREESALASIARQAKTDDPIDELLNAI